MMNDDGLCPNDDATLMMKLRASAGRRALQLISYYTFFVFVLLKNKRASVIFANHFLIAHGQGFLVIPEEHVSEFKKKLVAFYEGEDIQVVSGFLKKNCWKSF